MVIAFRLRVKETEHVQLIDIEYFFRLFITTTIMLPEGLFIIIIRSRVRSWQLRIDDAENFSEALHLQALRYDALTDLRG